jgi:hypothetical protein
MAVYKKQVILMLKKDNELVRNSNSQQVCATFKTCTITSTKLMTAAICSSKKMPSMTM